jgi:NIMA (never in mitosis gene a)-related kinase
MMSDFEVIKQLGTGSFSSVYKVMRKSDRIIYALKKVKMAELSSKEKENALNEVRILASIISPNVIRYKDAFLEEKTDSLCIVLEYCDCGDI